MSSGKGLFSRAIGMASSERAAPYLFISVPVVMTMLFFGYPVLFAFYISLHRWNLLDPERVVVWFANYTNLVTDQRFLNSLKNTAYFTGVYVSISLVVGLVLALLVKGVGSKMQSLASTIFFLPVMTSMVAVAITFDWMLRPTIHAPLNYLLSFLGLKPIGWLIDRRWAMNSIIGVTLWKNAGFVMIIYLAALHSIPSEYYEVARIDGAGRGRIFWHITFPLLRPTSLFLVITGVIGAFQVFTQTFVLTGGGPAGATQTIGLEIYWRAFRSTTMGTASAMAFVMFGLILTFTLLQLKYFGRSPTS